MSDAELEDELLSRRRARAARTQRRSTADGEPSLEAMVDRQMAQHYASLELQPGASADEVKRAYRRLVRRFHPDRHATDAARQRAATELTESLTRASEALLTRLERSTRP